VKREPHNPKALVTTTRAFKLSTKLSTKKERKRTKKKERKWLRLVVGGCGKETPASRTQRRNVSEPDPIHTVKVLSTLFANRTDNDILDNNDKRSSSGHGAELHAPRSHLIKTTALRTPP
jgi:hypothetical protein